MDDLLKNSGLSKSVQKKLSKIPNQQLQNMLEKYGNFPKEKTSSKNDDQGNFQLLSNSEKKQKEKNKMKRLKQRYGTVSEDKFYHSLNLVNNYKNKTNLKQTEMDALQSSKNIVDLYNYQHRNDEVEKEIDLELISN